MAITQPNINISRRGRGGVFDPVQADVTRSALPVLPAGVIFRSAHTLTNTQTGSFLGSQIYSDSLPPIVLHFPFCCDSGDIAGQQQCVCACVVHTRPDCAAGVLGPDSFVKVKWCLSSTD